MSDYKIKPNYKITVHEKKEYTILELVEKLIGQNINVEEYCHCLTVDDIKKLIGEHWEENCNCLTEEQVMELLKKHIENDNCVFDCNCCGCGSGGTGGTGGTGGGGSDFNGNADTVDYHHVMTLTISEYDNMAHDKDTLYFIKQ